jgi:hypothetical protein
MKRLLLAFAAITIFISAVYAQEHGAASRPERPPTKWVTYTSAEGRYTIDMTEQPKLSTQSSKTASGDTMVQYMAAAFADPIYLMVGYFDYPATVTLTLDAARNGMVSSIRGTVAEEESISLGGSPGRAVKILAKADNGIEFIDRTRLYDVNRRMYVLQCLVPVSNEGPGAIQMCNQFFDSFKVKSAIN